MKHTQQLTKSTCPELFNEMKQLAKDLGIKIPRKITVPQMELKIRMALFGAKADTYPQAI